MQPQHHAVQGRVWFGPYLLQAPQKDGDKISGEQKIKADGQAEHANAAAEGRVAPNGRIGSQRYNPIQKSLS